jgi:Ser/Thr protein kinase RdoA (MazF antagonist)
MNAEIPLTGGRVTQGVVRIGNTVRRPCNPNTPFIHQLLQHLERADFEGAPRLLGIDSQRREILTFIEGDVPPDLDFWSTEQLLATARLIRRFHEATVGSALAGDQEVVCHHDLSPCNTVFVNGLPQAFIDFDATAPGPRWSDLAYAAWLWLDLGNDRINGRYQGRRLRAFCAAYGYTGPGSFAELILKRQQWQLDRIWADAPFPPEQLRRAIDWMERCQAWVRQHKAELDGT